MNNFEYVIVTGNQLGGKFYLYNILNLHEDMEMLPEISFPLHLMDAFCPPVKSLFDNGWYFATFLGETSTDEINATPEWHNTWTLPRISKYLDITELTIKCSDIIAQNLNKKFVGDVNTLWAIRYPVWRKILPDAKLIIVRRKFEDIVKDVMEHFSGEKIEAEIKWRLKIEEILNNIKEGFIIHVDDLKEKPQKTIEEIIGYIGADINKIDMDKAIEYTKFEDNKKIKEEL